MKSKIKYRMLVLALVFACLIGCGKTEKHLDFEEIASIKVLLPNETESVSVFDREEVQNLLAQIEEITWTKVDEEYDEDDNDWAYRIVCYDIKGEKRINLILCSESKMVYKSAVWEAEDAQVDLSSFAALFQK